MMAQRPAFNLSKLSPADKIILLSASVFFIWGFIPVWYKLDCGPEIFALLRNLCNHRISGWHGVTIPALILAALAVAWVVARAAGSRINPGFDPGLVDLGLSGLGLLFTILAFVMQPTLFAFSWGVIVAVILALVWTYGGFMRYSEPASTNPPDVGTTGYSS